MVPRSLERRLGALLRGAGLAFMAAGLSGSLLLSGGTAAQAFPGISGLVAQQFRQILLPGAAGSPGPSPSPSPSTPLGVKSVASPGPRHARAVTDYTISGSLAMGSRFNASSSDSGPGTLNAQGANNVGLLFVTNRRSESTTTTVQIPVGLGQGGRTLFGQIQGGYYTPKYGLLYQAQSVGVLAAAPVGGTLRGFGLDVPTRRGDVTVYQGAANFDNYRLGTVYGARAREGIGSALYEAGFAVGLPGGSKDRITDELLGFATARGGMQQQIEAALQQRSGPSESGGGVAAQYRLDSAGVRSSSSITLRTSSDGFINFGTGALNADRYLDVGYHTSMGRNAVSLDESYERTGSVADPMGISLSRRSYGTLSRNMGAASVQLAATDQLQISPVGRDWIGGLGLQTGLFIGTKTSVLLAVQGTRSTLDYGTSTGQMSYQGLLQRTSGASSLGLGYQATRQTSVSGAPSLTGVTQVQFFRQFGRTTLGLATNFGRNVSATTNATQISPQFSIARQISPVIAIQANYGFQRLRDLLNPSANGSSRNFNIQIIAPFSFGNGAVAGRVDPRLPATISGTVLADTSTLGFASQLEGGVPNVMLVLDNGQVQRTDLTGRFQFSFVKPGPHQVRIETSSLPPGVVPDQPVAAIDVQGGQTANVAFRIGAFAAIAGHVLGRSGDGTTFPLSGVVVKIDKGQFVTTGPDGAYGFGRLQSGRHTVTIETATIPADVTFAKDQNSQTVETAVGSIAKIDFTALPLGAVTGKVMYDPVLAPDFSGPVLNAYVVAEPGDYSVITNDDGSFYLDNIPPGTYSLSVDPETLASGLSAEGVAQSVTVTGSQTAQGIVITVGREVKNVVFSFVQGGGAASASSVKVDEPRLPPGATSAVSVSAPSATAVSVDAFGRVGQLRHDGKFWSGTIFVPPGTKPGDATVTATVEGAHPSKPVATVHVDPSIRLIALRTLPPHPAIGQYVVVRARILLDVKPGDQIVWQDGQITKLGKPITGRVFQFSVKISELPLHGALVMQASRVPIDIL